jgi:hypothetical protein
MTDVRPSPPDLENNGESFVSIAKATVALCDAKGLPGKEQARP